jgi:signal transduction histidine kinase
MCVRVKDKKEILERNQELQEFSYRASHDLKAPLVSIAGLSEMAIEDCKNKNFDLAVKNMDQINSLSRRLKTFVDDILSLTKSEHLQSEHGVFSFQKCLENIQNKLEVFKTEASVKIVPAWNHQRELSIQPVRLNQILENLISNAMKYADIKKPEKIVNITTYNDESFFYITVSDNGIGIPKAYFDRVFQMFSRFHNDTIPGSGLGLYLVKKHVDKLKGTISFESSSLGTSFFIKLPLT